ncbi:MAG TPA: hypothetical protein VMD07_01010 [Candidatus Acidoferrales bacterium]|nr:hypothetical protein [Candidatus Acidoferrales bacterium]
MGNRGLGIISIVSGLIAVAIFIMVISAYASSGGSSTVAPVAQATPGQPVDSEMVYGEAGGQQQAATAPTAQPVNSAQPQSQSGEPPVTAPSANAPANPFTSGIH